MAGIDNTMWVNVKRLRKTVLNNAKVIMSLSAVNGFYTAYTKNWLLLGINVIFFILMIPTFISFAKFEKNPPVLELKEMKEKVKKGENSSIKEKKNDN